MTSAMMPAETTANTELVTKIFKIVGDDYPKCREQKRIRRFVSDEFDYLVTNNPDELKEEWIKEFPHEKKGIIKFFKDAKKIGKSEAEKTSSDRKRERANFKAQQKKVRLEKEKARKDAEASQVTGRKRLSDEKSE